MKRVLLLPILAMGLMVSQAWAASAECTGGNKTTNYICNWGATGGCWKLDADPAKSETCASRATLCGTGLLQITAADLATLTQGSNGYDCSDAKFTTVSGTPTFDALEDTGEGPCLSGSKQAFCQQAWGCMKLDTRYSSIGDGATATCSPTGTRCTCSQLISDCPAGQLYTDVNDAQLPNNGVGADVKCSNYGGILAGGSQPQPSSSSGGDPSSSSGGDQEPIISYNKAPVTGLNVVSFARNLQIASDKDATVALFDMHGKQVFSQKVLSGTTTISLGKQKTGVYYAVVRSGSQKQTVKVVLK